MIINGEIRKGNARLVVYTNEDASKKVIHVIGPAGDGYIGLDAEALDKLKELLFPS